MRRLTSLILLGLVINLCSCRVEPTSDISGTPASTYPSPQATSASATSPLATPMSATSPLTAPETGIYVPTIVPDPAAGKGTITGRLVDFNSGQPAIEIPLYLGKLSPFNIEGSESHLIEVHPNSSPGTKTDKHGYFTFLDIEPGTYAIVAWTPVNSWVISNPETELDILATVEADTITRLGELAVDLPN